jgi:hypothetical protein
MQLLLEPAAMAAPLEVVLLLEVLAMTVLLLSLIHFLQQAVVAEVRAMQQVAMAVLAAVVQVDQELFLAAQESQGKVLQVELDADYNAAQVAVAAVVPLEQMAQLAELARQAVQVLVRA